MYPPGCHAEPEGSAALQLIQAKMLLKVSNKTEYSTELLENLVQFVTPEEWKHLEQSNESFYLITFPKLRAYKGWNQAEFNGRAITVHILPLLELPLYGNRVIREGRGPAIIGGGYAPKKYQLPKKEQLPLRNFTEWLLAHIAHEVHHAYLHWLDPNNFTNAKKSLVAQAIQEKDCERYAVKVVKKWREAHGRKDLPFPQLKSIRRRVREENERIDAVQQKFDDFLDRIKNEGKSSPQQPP